MGTDQRAAFQLAALEWNCGIVDPENNHEERVMYFADNEPGVEPGSMTDYALILGGAALAVVVIGVFLTAAGWHLGLITL